MPRAARAAAGGIVYHAFNRGNGGTGIFRTPDDYAAFLQLLIEGKENARVELFGFCLMPNHWHLIVRPRGGRDLSRYLSWLTNTHVKRFRAEYPRTSGHLYQGRYKSFPVADDVYLPMLVRFVEATPLIGKRVDRAQDWAWSSLGCERVIKSKLLDPWPVDRPRNWKAIVNCPMSTTENERVRASLDRGRPLGNEEWTRRMAERLALQYTLNPRGRPKKILQREH